MPSLLSLRPDWMPCLFSPCPDWMLSVLWPEVQAFVQVI
uniref:Uncharacterized protein n=1 Tax=Anguilla anguilla TaxID=7936 RepID=A0A0E9RTI0_ANGAN